MAEISITQSEADDLISMVKLRADDLEYSFPDPGDRTSVPLVSIDRREEFNLDIGRGRIEFQKVTYQNRARKVIILVRLDLTGPMHRNPDGEEISCPHLHLYREGYADKWAYPVPQDRFRKPDDLWENYLDFLQYCNIREQPLARRGVF